MLPGLLPFPFAPGRRGWASTRSAPLTPAQRVIDRVHGHATNLGPTSTPAVCARLTNHLELVVAITHLADCGPALLAHTPHLGRGQTQRDVVSFFANCVKIGRTSIRVKVSVWAKRRGLENIYVTEAYVTMVAVDDDLNPVSVKQPAK